MDRPSKTSTVMSRSFGTLKTALFSCAVAWGILFGASPDAALMAAPLPLQDESGVSADESSSQESSATTESVAEVDESAADSSAATETSTQSAADAPNTDEPAEAVTADETEPADPTAVEEDSDHWERLIYIPYQKLATVFGSEDASVMLPYEEYRKLTDHFLKSQLQAEDGTPNAVLRSSDYTLRVDEEMVRVSAVYEVQMRVAGRWGEILLPFGNAAVGAVACESAETFLTAKEPGTCRLFVRGEGTHQIRIDLMVPVETSPDARRFALQVPSVAMTECLVDLPGRDQEITVRPAPVDLPIEGNAPEDRTLRRFRTGAVNQLAFSFAPRSGSRPVMDLLTSVNTTESHRLETELLQTTTSLVYEVLRGEMTEAVILLPEEAVIIDVTSPDGRIGNWSTEVNEGIGRRMVVEFPAPIERSVTVQIRTERPVDQSLVRLFGQEADERITSIRPEGIIREAGTIRLDIDSSLTLTVKDQDGLRQVAAGADNSASGTAWTWHSRSGSLVVSTRPVEPRLRAAQETRLIFRDGEIQYSSTLNYTIERTGVFSVRLQVPEGLTIENVTADGMSEFQVDSDSSVLTVSLREARQGNLVVNLRGRMDLPEETDAAPIVLPSVEALDVERESGRIDVYSLPFLDLASQDDRLTGVFPTRNYTLPPLSGLVGVSSWSYTQRPFEAAVRVTTRPAQMSATIASTAEVRPDVIVISSEIRMTVRNAGFNVFRISVPETISDRIRFETTDGSPAIQQRSASEPEDGWVIWTLTLAEDVLGTVQLRTEWEHPLAEGEDEASTEAADFSLPRILEPFADESDSERTVRLTSVRGEFRVTRDDSLSVRGTLEADAIQPVDVRELELLPREGDLAYRYFSQPATVRLLIRRHEVHEVVETVVTRALTEFVTERQAVASCRCRLRIVSSERQRLRIDLPAGADLQAPLLNNRRTTIERLDEADTAEDREAYVVNISREEDSDEEFLITLMYRFPIVSDDEIPFEGRGGRQRFRLPVVGGEDAGIVVQQTRVAIWKPDDVLVVGEPERWRRSSRHQSGWFSLTSAPGSSSFDGDGWMNDGGSTDSGFARQGTVAVFTTPGMLPTLDIDWWNWPFLVAVLSGALILIGLILRTTSWENRITLLFIGCFAAGVWAMKDPIAAQGFASAAAPGLAVVGLIWIVSGILGRRQPAAPTSTSPTTPKAVTKQAPPEPESPSPPANNSEESAKPSTDDQKESGGES